MILCWRWVAFDRHCMDDVFKLDNIMMFYIFVQMGNVVHLTLYWMNKANLFDFYENL
jgi:hypothetical protein